jgi:hypothetical protein
VVCASTIEASRRQGAQLQPPHAIVIVSGVDKGRMHARVGRGQVVLAYLFNIEATIDNATLLRMGWLDRVHHGALRTESERGRLAGGGFSTSNCYSDSRI